SRLPSCPVGTALDPSPIGPIRGCAWCGRLAQGGLLRGPPFVCFSAGRQGYKHGSSRVLEARLADQVQEPPQSFPVGSEGDQGHPPLVVLEESTPSTPAAMA